MFQILKYGMAEYPKRRNGDSLVDDSEEGGWEGTAR